MADVNSYPAADRDLPLVVYGQQGTPPTAVRADLPEEINQQNASLAEARHGGATNRIMTPATAAEVTTPLRNEILNNWGDWSGSIIYGTASSTFSGITKAADSADVRTASLGSANIMSFHSTSTGIPSIAGDTFRFGLAAGNTAHGRLAVMHFDTLGPTLWQLVNGSWVRILEHDNPVLEHYMIGLRTSGDWHVFPPSTTDAPSVFGIDSSDDWFLVKKFGDHLQAYVPTYNATFMANGVLNPYGIKQHRRNYSAQSVTITGGQVVTALSTLTGNDRPDFSLFKNLPDGGSGNSIPDNGSVTRPKLAATGNVPPIGTDQVEDASITPAKLSTTGVQDGDVLKYVSGSWGTYPDNVLDSLGPDSVPEGANQDDSIDLGTKGKSATLTSGVCADGFVITRLVGERAITKSKHGLNSVGLSELDGEGATNKYFGTDSSGNPAHITPPSWGSAAISGSYTPSAASGTLDLSGTAEFSDYEELSFQGRGQCTSVTLPGALWNATSSSNRINLAVGTGGHAQIYKSGDAELTYVVVAGSNSDHGIHAIWGKK